MTDLYYHLFCTRHWAGRFKHCCKGATLYPFFSQRNKDQKTEQHVCDYFPNILIRYCRVTELPKTSWRFRPGSGMHFRPLGYEPSAFVCSVIQSCLTVCDPMDCVLPAPLSMVFSRQEYWSGLPFPSPGDLPQPRIKPVSPESPALAGQFFTTEPSGNPLFFCHHLQTDVFLCFWDFWFWLLTSPPLLSATWSFLLQWVSSGLCMGQQQCSK